MVEDTQQETIDIDNEEFNPPTGILKKDKESKKPFPRINEWEVKIQEVKEENFKLENGEFDSFGYSRATQASYLFGYCKILQLTLNDKIMLGQNKENPLTDDEIMEFYKRQEQSLIKLCETYSLLEIMNTDPDLVRPLKDKEGNLIPGKVALNPEKLKEMGGVIKDDKGVASLNWNHLKEKYDREMALRKGVEKDGEVSDANLKKNLEYLNERRVSDSKSSEEGGGINEESEEGENDREILYRQSIKESE